jgi:hypothetical protein
MRRIAWLALPALVAAACSGKGNSGRKEIDPALIAEVPWVNGAPPLIDAAGKAVVPNLPVYPPIGQNQADPGSRVRFDTAEEQQKACAPLQGIERSQWHLDFGPTDPTNPNNVGVAPFFSAYDDHTDGAWHVPGDAAWYDGNGGRRDGTIWGLASDTIENGPRCDGELENRWAMHVRGGRFNWFGGGAEHVLELDCSLGHQNAEICDHVVDVVGDGRVDKAVDVSQFDGLSFWARRGPDGASGLQVVLQDKYTSDRLARTSTAGAPGIQYCQRYLVCFGTEKDSAGQERCQNGAACVPVTQGDFPRPIYRCVPDGADPSATFEPALMQKLYPPCGPDECLPPTYDRDLDFEESKCKPYNFTGLEENYYCFGDKPPPAADERCGDGFVSNISLSTDWQYYKLPFDGFQQVGFGKKAPPNDVPQKTLYTISFLFSVGYTDFFLDNVTFYRNK